MMMIKKQYEMQELFIGNDKNMEENGKKNFLFFVLVCVCVCVSICVCVYVYVFKKMKVWFFL